MTAAEKPLLVPPAAQAQAAQIARYLHTGEELRAVVTSPHLRFEIPGNARFRLLRRLGANVLAGMDTMISTVRGRVIGLLLLGSALLVSVDLGNNKAPSDTSVDHSGPSTELSPVVRPRMKEYKVKQGDTLWGYVADFYGLDRNEDTESIDYIVNSIKEQNPGWVVDLIHVGDIITFEATAQGELRVKYYRTGSNQ